MVSDERRLVSKQIQMVLGRTQKNIYECSHAWYETHTDKYLRILAWYQMNEERYLRIHDIRRMQKNIYENIHMVSNERR